MKLERFKNYGLWVSLAALIPLVLTNLGINILPPNYSNIVSLALSFLVALGILNNPSTSNKWFLDDMEKIIKELDTNQAATGKKIITHQNVTINERESNKKE